MFPAHLKRLDGRLVDRISFGKTFPIFINSKVQKTESWFIGQTNWGQITVFYMHFWSLNRVQLSGIPKRLVGYSVIEQQFDCLYAGEGRSALTRFNPKKRWKTGRN